MLLLLLTVLCDVCIPCLAQPRPQQHTAVPTTTSPTPFICPCPFASLLQGLSNMLYATVQLGLQPPTEWLVAWLDAAAPRLAAFDPQHTSNSLWALASLGFHPGEWCLNHVFFCGGGERG